MVCCPSHTLDEASITSAIDRHSVGERVRILLKCDRPGLSLPPANEIAAAFRASSGSHAILDVVGDLVANLCQVEQFLLEDWIFGFFRQLPIFLGFVSKIIVEIHRGKRRTLLKSV